MVTLLKSLTTVPQCEDVPVTSNIAAVRKTTTITSDCFHLDNVDLTISILCEDHSMSCEDRSMSCEDHSMSCEDC